MSAVIALLHPAAGYLFSDGAFWGSDGRLQQIGPKMHPLPRLKAAVAFRGVSPPFAYSERALNDCADLAALMAFLPKYAKLALNWPTYERFKGTTEITVMAWNGDRPEAWSLTAEDPKAEGYGGMLQGAAVGPYQWVRLGMLAGAPFFDTGALGRPLRDAIDLLKLDPETDGLRIMELQRAATVPVAGIGPVHIVGGFCDMATVDAAGVTVKRLRTWPDVIGEKISPDRLVAAA